MVIGLLVVAVFALVVASLLQASLIRTLRADVRLLSSALERLTAHRVPPAGDVGAGTTISPRPTVKPLWLDAPPGGAERQPFQAAQLEDHIIHMGKLH